ncbi:MAG TPA: SulP family inorganic anion transporter [Steroidobacteraceae bacterium]|jgi:SulP family sulfate permease|nr:SulP family inorganic anion transporter [Steroidobacteraceae bacterium]
MIAILEAHRAGLLKRVQLMPNIIAGLVVGIVAMPLAMAFAIASGATPAQGLYTAIVAGLVTSLFGGTRVQISGPTGAFIAVLAGITAQYGVAGLQAATLMAGFILLVMGLARLGSVIKFIPSPVIVGFTAGIGVIIWTGQWKDFFGLHPGASGLHFHEKFIAVLRAFPDLHPATTAMAALTLFILIAGNRWFPRVPGLKRVPAPLVAMLIATLIQAVWQFPGVATIGSAFGGIPRALPGFSWPALSLADLLQLVGPAFAIALLGAIESLLTAVVADGMTGARHDSNQELIGQGAANILAPLFGGFAATGAIARTATNIRNGATSPVAGIVHSVLLLLIILLLAPLAAHIPLAALAAILFVVAWNMADAPHVLRVLRTAALADRFLLLITFFLTVFVDLVVAVNVGVVLAALIFMRRMAETVRVEQQAFDDDSGEDVVLPRDVLVYRVEGPFFFGAAEKLERTLERVQLGIETIVIRLGRVPFMDATGVSALAEIVQRFQRRRIRVLLCGIHDELRQTLDAGGVTALVGDANICASMKMVAERVAVPTV